MGGMPRHEPILSPHPSTGHLLPLPLGSGLPPSLCPLCCSLIPSFPVLGTEGARESRTQRGDRPSNSYLAEMGLESVRSSGGAGCECWRQGAHRMGLSSSGRWADVVGGLRDRAQVYSTVHVSPVWLGGWRRGPVGVTTEARVCEGQGRGGEGVGGERGEQRREEGAKEGGEMSGPSFRPGPLSSEGPLPHTLVSCHPPAPPNSLSRTSASSSPGDLL